MAFPLTLLRSLEPAWEPGWDPPWELGWELGVLELEELPLLVLCKGLSTMVSVLLRSGLLARMGWEPSRGPRALPLPGEFFLARAGDMEVVR